MGYRNEGVTVVRYRYTHSLHHYTYITSQAQYVVHTHTHWQGEGKAAQSWVRIPEGSTVDLTRCYGHIPNPAPPSMQSVASFSWVYPYIIIWRPLPPNLLHSFTLLHFMPSLLYSFPPFDSLELQGLPGLA